MVRVVRHAPRKLPDARGPLPKAPAFMLPYYHATFNRKPMSIVRDVQECTKQAQELFTSDLHEVCISKQLVEDRVRFMYCGDPEAESISVDLDVIAPLQKGYAHMFVDGPVITAGLANCSAVTVTVSPIVGGTSVSTLSGAEVIDRITKLLTNNNDYTLKIRFHELVFITEGIVTTFTYKG